MDRFDRIFQIHQILSNARVPVSRRQLEEQLECKGSTIKRTLHNMKLYLGAPIVYDPTYNGYHYVEARDEHQHKYELPGLWFTAPEIYALLTSQQLFNQIQPGLLDRYIHPLQSRFEQLLKSQHLTSQEINHRVRILPSAVRPTDRGHFRSITTALVKRRRLHLLYHGRERDEITERTVSPQRLVYYRDNWYLDAWCHLRKGLRSFSLDRLHPVYIAERQAREVDEHILDAHFSSAYGIFAGKAKHRAILRFTPEATKWVADEQWHQAQQISYEEDGGCQLQLPYGDDRELIKQIMQYGAGVEVMAPSALRRKVAQEHSRAAAQYEK